MGVFFFFFLIFSLAGLRFNTWTDFVDPCTLNLRVRRFCGKMLQWAIPVDGLQDCVNGFLGFELPLTWHGALVGFWCLVPQGLISFAAFRG